jgi:hypothetical protein
MLVFFKVAVAFICDFVVPPASDGRYSTDHQEVLRHVQGGWALPPRAGGVPSPTGVPSGSGACGWIATGFHAGQDREWCTVSGWSDEETGDPLNADERAIRRRAT